MDSARRARFATSFFLASSRVHTSRVIEISPWTSFSGENFELLIQLEIRVFNPFLINKILSPGNCIHPVKLTDTRNFTAS